MKRSWSRVLDTLPSLRGQTIIDLGCGPGDAAAEMAARGARVVGFDMNEDSLREARSRRIPGADFRTVDLRGHPDLGVEADGLWSSFSAAYFTDLAAALAAWSRNCRPGAWIAVTEIDDLFGHEPLGVRTKELLFAYTEEGFMAGRYDFRMGRRLESALESAGFNVSLVRTLDDPELSFDGPASAEVLDSWRSRFQRMPLLRDLCGSEFENVREEFLDCLTRADHRSLAKVVSVIAAKDVPP